jgi:hypothetical protein
MANNEKKGRENKLGLFRNLIRREKRGKQKR